MRAEPRWISTNESGAHWLLKKVEATRPCYGAAVSLLFLTELSCLCVSERVKKTNVIECKKSDPIPSIES